MAPPRKPRARPKGRSRPQPYSSRLPIEPGSQDHLGPPVHVDPEVAGDPHVAPALPGDDVPITSTPAPAELAARGSPFARSGPVEPRPVSTDLPRAAHPYGGGVYGGEVMRERLSLTTPPPLEERVVKGETPDWCARPYRREDEILASARGLPYEWEDHDYQHTSEDALVEHLETFFGFNGARTRIKQYGVALVNEALQEIPDLKSLHSPAGFLHSLLRQKAKEVQHGNQEGDRRVPHVPPGP